MIIHERVESWIEEFMKRRKVEQYQIVTDISAPANTGYMSDINFVTVNCVTKNKEKQTLYLVMKNDFSKRTQVIRLAFKVETHIFGKVVPAFQKFEESKSITDTIDKCFPTLYDSFTKDDTQILITENVTNLGYRMHDRMKPMDMNHCKILLKEYARFHALCFAYRDQEPEQFKRLCNIDDVYVTFTNEEKENMTSDAYGLLEFLEKRGELKLRNKLKHELQTRFKNGLEGIELFHDKEEQLVFIHGDNWNNNHMFIYSDEEPPKPVSVLLIDYQLSCLRSPAFDLALLFFLVCGKKELDQLEVLLEMYHKFFTEYLKKLGSNENLFTYSDLKRHWKNYSIFGIIIMIIDMKMIVNGNIETGYAFSETAAELYYERVIPALSSYFKYKELP